jgi:acetyl esterase/lipase
MRVLLNIVSTIVSTILIIISFFLFILIIGLLIPGIPLLSMGSSMVTSFFTVQLLIASIIIGGLSFALFKWRRRKIAMVSLGFSIIAFLGFTIAIAQLKSFAGKSGVDISISKGAKLGIAWGVPDTLKSILYDSVDGHKLFMDISKPADFATKTDLIPVVMIHGGGYVTGSRGMMPNWQYFYTNRGYVVFDVDYRLSTKSYHTWDKSAKDIVTALDWVNQNSGEYHVDMHKLIISGSSAGGALALLAAYGLVDKTFQTISDVPVPKAVIALYPAQELVSAYYKKAEGQKQGQEYCNQYFGGSPEYIPQAYAFVYPGNHIRKSTPPTLIIAGKVDVLVPFEGQEKLAGDLKKTGVPFQLVNLPYGVHGFDLSSNSLSSQVAYGITAKFLDKYVN